MAQASKKKAKKGQKARKKSKKKKKYALTAKTSDKHELYEHSVQNPESDIKFLNRVFKKERGRKPLTLREDFCGTAWTCAEWVDSNDERTAVGVDLDAKTQKWGVKKHIEPLGEDASRVTLLTQNVLDPVPGLFDITVAFNFSYSVFLDRPTLKEYFAKVKDSLKGDGLFSLDIHGGPESLEELEETTEHDDFDYVWDQGPMDPISHRTTRKIHFRFPDKSEIKNAFRYDWRVWFLPELKEALEEVGFERVDIYWEGYDKNGDGNGIFRKVQRAENDDSWIAYICAWK